ncbi:HpcH/HpaI aldolase/citrate lyase family protein [Stenotrophomonas rhizophila]|uniref:HpcH/HpaI aldolase/citrate lyase family protein n=1 Tax=Stenotrophomonas rhizophila TaxID=216778 RepID=UPI001E418C7C|nr:CoA ester lyase [Stenotrophomonas rhizophila]MCC7635000.1 CoA ester lyase [Stenotrophomonas rhizophila]MCC7662623.1 CoA ester lyase [Stenotrophomonas rhizophila]
MRSKLFVPGARPDLFDKALASQADALSFDLEDSVPETGKAQARAQVAGFVQRPQTQAGGKLLIVRTNATDSAHFAADLGAVALPGVGLLNLPKIDSVAQLLAAIAALERAERDNGVGRPIGLLVTIETPRGLRCAAELAAAHPRVAGLQLGLGDLFAPNGIHRGLGNVHATLFALRLAAAEADVFAYDGAFPNVADSDGFLAEAQMAQQLGFIGKSCIHPRQVGLANATFGIAPALLDEARRIVAAAGNAAGQGHGAFLFEGRMIDLPYLRRAEALLAASSTPTA